MDKQLLLELVLLLPRLRELYFCFNPRCQAKYGQGRGEDEHAAQSLAAFPSHQSLPLPLATLMVTPGAKYRKHLASPPPETWPPRILLYRTFVPLEEGTEKISVVADT